MAVHDRLQVETCQICFDDFEVISVGGPDDDDDAQTVGLEPFFAREDFYDDDELEQLLLALHLSTLDVPEEALTHSPPPLTSKSETPPSRQSPTSQQRGSRPGTTRSSTSTTTSSTTTTQTRSTASSSVSSPPPYTDRESLGLGFSLPCDKEHLFCSNCLNRYIDLKLQSKIWPIVCPNENCKGGIPPAIIESLLGDKSAKWYELSVERAVTNKVYCPNKECNRLLDGDDFDFESDQTKNILNNTTCPHCSVPFCAFCLKAPHGGKIQKEGSGDLGRRALPCTPYYKRVH
ncbi:hypothetical protein B0O80DRAFT_455402 [Mortierella sp. GBAus27b]|nr:hypothetical protein B0O80DRAFT_455402 [Mortierella sp. GBAus27b]